MPRGAATTIASPKGEAIVVAAPRGMAGLGFVDDGDRSAALADMARRWPRARLIGDEGATGPYARRAFDPALWRPDAPSFVELRRRPSGPERPRRSSAMARENVAPRLHFHALRRALSRTAVDELHK